jgi:nitrate reductase assembly molybdenum cofactor insertion protein NarJ
MTLTPHELALARARTYRLLGEIALDGWTPRALEVVRNLPDLSPVVLGRDPEELAASHHAVLGRGVPPYESVFLGDGALLGGDVTASVRQAYADGGFRLARADTEPDHLGLELAYLAFLCSAEADALTDGLDGVATAIAERARRFLDGHLLRWLPALSHAVRRQGRVELSAVVELALELACAHRADVGVWYADAGLAMSPALLDDPDTGLSDIAEWLLAPVRSGLWLSADDVRRMALGAELPCGFGTRGQMLETLLFTGVDHERVDVILDALRAEVRRAEDGYSELARMKAPVAAWQARLHSTKELLDRMALA